MRLRIKSFFFFSLSTASRNVGRSSQLIYVPIELAIDGIVNFAISITLLIFIEMYFYPV